MLFLTKKRDAQPVAAPRWHVNFRDFERLPDTKVVRTTFFINAAAMGLALAVVLLLGYREYANRNLREQIAATEEQIASKKNDNAAAVKLSKTFAVEQQKIREVSEFVKVPITMTDFVDVIGTTLPKEVIIDYVDARWGDTKASMFQMRGRVAGSPDQASGIASNYVDLLRANPRLSAVFDSITLNRIERNAEGTFLLFDISLTLKTGKK